MAPGGSERAEAGKGSVQTVRKWGQTISSVFSWMRGAEHRLAQVAIRPPPIRQPHALRGFGAGQPLLGPVINAGNAQREELQDHPRRNLVIGGGLGRKSQLVAEDVIVVIQYRNVPPPQAPARSHHGVARIEAVEISAGRVE